MNKKPDLPLVVIVGETASGKSKLAFEVAKEMSGELICADSRTIYKGMDIGTAKPSKKERAEVKHHLLDLIEPNARFTVADFKHRALEAISEIREKGNLPIMVGGTGLYVDSVIYDYQFRTQYNQKIREALSEKSLDELTKIALESGFSRNELAKNKRQIIRMLEAGPSKDQDRKQLIPNLILVGLSPKRSILRENIQSRIEVMFKKGLRKEVDELVNKYGWGHESLTGIGYREFEEYYKRSASISHVKRTIIQHTLNYAKRQRTWFKRNPKINWFENSKDAKIFVMENVLNKKV